MGNMTRRNWPKGWLPATDLINGDREGLIRMDNLYLDEEGVLSLVRGIDKINDTPFVGYVHSCYSKYIGSKKYRYVGLSNGWVSRSSGGAWENIIVDGEAVNTASFGSAFGQ